MMLHSSSVFRWVLFTAGVAAALLAGWWMAKTIHQGAPTAVVAQEAQVRSSDRQVVHLYFGDTRERYLIAEQRIVPQSSDDVALSRRLIELLVQGPTQGGSRTLPADAGLRALHITSSGTAFLDFEDEAFAGHPGGAAAELLSIYSIVNTLVLNVEGVRSVKFLIGGREAATLAGHVDLQDPFEVDMLWVR
jgi:hypothetical protein